jgi:lipopolysaccharide export system permease protein
MFAGLNIIHHPARCHHKTFSARPWVKSPPPVTDKTCPAAVGPNTLRGMRLLDRYLFRELLMPLAVCLIGIQAFVVVFTVFTDAQKIQEAKLHFLETIEYAMASAMELIPVVLPVCLLLALLITLTYYARHNEITAMRAAGVSLWRISLPYFAVGLVASGGLFALNELVVPRSIDRADRILHRYVTDSGGREKPNVKSGGYFNSRAHRLWYYSEYRAGPAEMIAPHVGWYLPDGSYPYRTVTAERAIYTNGVWTLFSNVIETEQTSPTAQEVRILVTNVLAMPQFKETPQDIELDIRFSKYEKINLRKLHVPLAELWRHLKAHPEETPALACKWWTMFEGRLAAPWTCLVVVLIAIPFGAASGRRNLFFGVAGSIFICFSFFVVQQFSLAFGSGGYLPPWLAAWLPNMVFATAGLVMMARVR